MVTGIEVRSSCVHEKADSNRLLSIDVEQPNHIRTVSFVETEIPYQVFKEVEAYYDEWKINFI